LTGPAGPTGAKGDKGDTGAAGADGVGLTNASVGQNCTVSLPGRNAKAGTFQWFEQAAGVYVMSCDTNN
jgi:hypothetical protein